jgi:hypothetical protein
LAQDYGRPVKEEENWKEDYYRNNLGKAVMNGDLELNTYWRQGKTGIALVVRSQNDQLQFILGYYDVKEFEKLR